MEVFLHTVKDPMGVHARPAGALVKRIKEYPGSVTIVYGDKEVDAKKLFAIMSLAIKSGETVSIKVIGENEQAYARELQTFLNQNL